MIEPSTYWKCPHCGAKKTVPAYELANVGTPHCSDCEEVEMERDTGVPEAHSVTIGIAYDGSTPPLNVTINENGDIRGPDGEIICVLDWFDRKLKFSAIEKPDGEWQHVIDLPVSPVPAPRGSAEAEVHSDDHVHEVDFNAAAWFEKATEQEILDLVGCDWGGDYPADAVAEFMQTKDHRIRDLFDYLDRMNHGCETSGRDTVGFECHVDPDDAMEWLSQYRPDVLERIAKED